MRRKMRRLLLVLAAICLLSATEPTSATATTTSSSTSDATTTTTTTAADDDDDDDDAGVVAVDANNSCGGDADASAAAAAAAATAVAKPAFMDELVSDCCCTAETLTQTNSKLLPVLDDLAHTQFFKYFKVQMDAPCPFWAMQQMCGTGGGCQVCVCEKDEVPDEILGVDDLQRGADFVEYASLADLCAWDEIDEVEIARASTAFTSHRRIMSALHLKRATHNSLTLFSVTSFTTSKYRRTCGRRTHSSARVTTPCTSI
jgi:hypothetical protein